MIRATHDSDVLTISVLRDAPPIGRQGFGIPMILGPNGPPTPKVYTSAKAAKADATAGVISNELADYVAAAFSQVLKPKKIVVANREDDQLHTVSFQIMSSDDGLYSIEINGQKYDYDATSKSADEIAQELHDKIEVDNQLSVSVSGDTVQVSPVSGLIGKPLVYSASGKIDAVEVQSNRNIKDSLYKAAADDGSWFGFAITSRDNRDNEFAIEWAEENQRFVALQTSVPTDALKNKGYRNGYLMYRKDNQSKAAWKLLTNRLSLNLDRTTSIWSYVNLIGEEAEVISDSEKTKLQNYNMSYYLTFKNMPCTRAGVNPAGEKLDVVITAFWTEARIGERIAKIVLDTVNRGDKIPYDDYGFKLLENEVKDVLQLGERAGHYQPESTNVKFTKFSELSDMDKAARRAPFTFGGLLSGGVEEFEGIGYATTDDKFLRSLFGDEE